MKVNTDSIVLGSWALSKIQTSELLDFTSLVPNMLDIGSGNGLLSIMLAQEFKGGIQIDAVELDNAASQQGAENIANCSWCDSVFSHNTDIRRFVDQPDKRQSYDLIISNPPYFPAVNQATQAYAKQSKQRKIARNQEGLPIGELLEVIARSLNARGVAFICLPAIELNSVIQLADSHQLSLSYCLHLRSTLTKAPYLVCLGFSKLKAKTHYSELIIYERTNVYTNDYRMLCANFYRNF